MDLSPSSSMSPLFHKPVTGSSTTGPEGFLSFGGTTPIVLTPGTYYARLFNYNVSTVTTFTVRDCAIPDVPTDPACQVKGVQKYPANFESLSKSAAANLYVGNQQDANGVYQVYTSQTGTSGWKCLTCTAVPGGPAVNRDKMMVSWHPSGKWIIVGVEETTHDLSWAPRSWQIGWMQSGIWLNMWVTTPSGDRWFQLTDFTSAHGPSNGFVGTPFTPDGSKAVWAEIVGGNIFQNFAGQWKLYSADFVLGANGAPSLVNKKDITPAGARWVEPGNISVDGRHLALSTDIGIADAEGQDQWSLDLRAGALQQLTNSPTIWDEHGMYSPNGKHIAFMSSYPYRNAPDTWRMANLRTEIMLMDADGSHLQQLTHFNSPGYPESMPGNTVSAIAQFISDGSQMFVTVMGPNFSKTNWIIAMQGACGGSS